MLLYQDATIEDLPLIVEIYNSTISSRMVTADTEPVTIESRLNWFHEHHPLTRPLWVVSDNNDAVGWVSYQSFYGRPAYKGTAEISIYLNEQHRGKKYGEQILEYVIDKCPQLEIKTLLGFIFGHNEPSLRLFYKKGFADWGKFPRVAEMDGIERDLIIVGKRIYN